MLTITYHELKNISLLKDDWERLASGEDMTYFQSYDWYKMLCDKNCNLKSRNFECTIAVVREDNKPVLIAPLWIVYRNFGRYHKKGIYFFGGGQWSDYVNFIYIKTSSKIIDFLLREVSEKYRVFNFSMRQIPEYSKVYEIFDHSPYLVSKTDTICSALTVPDSEENYKKLLSKNFMQNIRTAGNRMKKDGLTLIFNYDDQDIDIEEFKKYRNVRVTKKNENNHGKLKYTVSRLINKFFRFKTEIFNPYNPFVDDPNSKFLTAKTSDGQLCAAFNYGLDKVQNSIVVMAVSLNPAFYKYSPGILLLYNFVLKQIKEKDIKVLDFTRGDEKYKFSLGSEKKTISRFWLLINHDN